MKKKQDKTKKIFFVIVGILLILTIMMIQITKEPSWKKIKTTPSNSDIIAGRTNVQSCTPTEGKTNCPPNQYCSSMNKICKTYEQCKLGGEPSLAGDVCFAGV